MNDLSAFNVYLVNRCNTLFVTLRTFNNVKMKSLVIDVNEGTLTNINNLCSQDM